ncbi:hypothetical protein LJR084_006593 [Variovorax sp. LjRoot84]|uniref:hypothetical protein n=1 Tax=Variovorax sp. LjRoot84 TaxID=3342340 RepID=UPI003ED07204
MKHEVISHAPRSKLLVFAAAAASGCQRWAKQLKITYPKKNHVNKQSDFEDLKEGQVVEVAKSAQIFSVRRQDIDREDR